MSELSPAVRSSLDALASFFVGEVTVSDTLLRVAELAVVAVEPAAFAGMTLFVDDRLQTAVFTDPEAPEIDRAQYDSGKGPCVESFFSGEVRELHSTRVDNPWPEFSAACIRHGILSTLSLPVMFRESKLGALNLYATAEAAMNAPEIETASLFASQASIALANAQAYWDARSLSEQLSESIKSREVIDQAKGIIMAARRCSAEEAFATLKAQSQATNTKVRTIAQDLVNDIAKRRSQ
jgi:GAF domain-containing protein